MTQLPEIEHPSTYSRSQADACSNDIRNACKSCLSSRSRESGPTQERPLLACGRHTIATRVVCSAIYQTPGVFIATAAFTAMAFFILPRHGLSLSAAMTTCDGHCLVELKLLNLLFCKALMKLCAHHGSRRLASIISRGTAACCLRPACIFLLGHRQPDLLLTGDEPCNLQTTRSALTKCLSRCQVRSAQSYWFVLAGLPIIGETSRTAAYRTISKAVTWVSTVHTRSEYMYVFLL